jgi:virginiamycin A acetyltransferase
MIVNIAVLPNEIIEPSIISVIIDDNRPPFPVAVMDRDSYIVSGEIQSGVNFDPDLISHNLQIGRYCSFADKIKFILSLNHDYQHITTGVCSFLQGIVLEHTLPQHNQILIQNDVWIGSGATIMSGVTIHNGAVVAANSHVVKDVPPYAIVGGNPAKVIRYRFTQEQIEKLLNISWWLWDEEKLQQNKLFFNLPVETFIKRFYRESTVKVQPLTYKKTTPIYLFFPDFDADYPLIEYILRQFCHKFDPDEAELLLYVDAEGNSLKESLTEQYTEWLNYILNEIGQKDHSTIKLLIDHLPDERPLFQISDYYITNRAKETVQRTCYADMYQVEVISGVDKPVFM